MCMHVRNERQRSREHINILLLCLLTVYIHLCVCVCVCMNVCVYVSSWPSECPWRSDCDGVRDFCASDGAWLVDVVTDWFASSSCSLFSVSVTISRVPNSVMRNCRGERDTRQQSLTCTPIPHTQQCTWTDAEATGFTLMSLPGRVAMPSFQSSADIISKSAPGVGPSLGGVSVIL